MSAWLKERAGLRGNNLSHSSSKWCGPKYDAGVGMRPFAWPREAAESVGEVLSFFCPSGRRGSSFRHFDRCKINSGEAWITVGFSRQPQRLCLCFSVGGEVDYIAAGIVFE